MLSGSLAFLDLETTGGDIVRDRIIEIGLCLTDNGEPTGEWSSLVNPGRPIPPAVERVTGIGDPLVASAPPFSDIAGEVAERLRGRIIVAHNARFDYGFLRQEFGRAGIVFQSPVLCTVRLSRRLYPQHRRHGLDALIERHGLLCRQRHRALGDARVLWEFIRALERETPSGEFALQTERLLRRSLPRRQLSLF